jgi:hypothetical protein
MSFMSAALLKLRMITFRAQAGSALIRLFSSSLGIVLESTQMCSGDRIFRALTAIFKDILCPVLPAKSMMNMSSLMLTILPIFQLEWKT